MIQTQTIAFRMETKEQLDNFSSNEITNYFMLRIFLPRLASPLICLLFLFCYL
jgi:hypothetical protein